MTVKEQVEKIKAVFPCIDSSCDQDGCIPHQVGEDEWEAQQCEFCYKIRFPMLEEAEKQIEERDRLSREEFIAHVKGDIGSRNIMLEELTKGNDMDGDDIDQQIDHQVSAKIVLEGLLESFTSPLQDKK